MKNSSTTKRNSSHHLSFQGSEKTPKGQCPLCYTENPYSRSHCTECNLPLPWAKAEMHEREPCGHCLKCQSENPYTSLSCWSCGARLAWANAVSPLAQQALPKAIQNGGAPSANGYHAPMPISGTSTLRVASQSFYAADEPNQIIDAVSLVCPPLGFIAYVTLLGQLPRQALNAARFALYGLGVWMFLLIIFFVMPNIKIGKFGKKNYQAAVPVLSSVNPNSETANEIYQ